jgi:hypothetical protein
MRGFYQGAFRQQARFLRHQFLQGGELAFSNVLSEDVIARSLAVINTCWLDRIYSPLVTLWVFLGQVLSADHSCRAAVARLIAHRVTRGQFACDTWVCASLRRHTAAGSGTRGPMGTASGKCLATHRRDSGRAFGGSLWPSRGINDVDLAPYVAMFRSKNKLEAVSTKSLRLLLVSSAETDSGP